jgi:hypothetical protein
VIQQPAQASWNLGGDKIVLPCPTPETGFYGLISCPPNTPPFLMFLYISAYFLMAVLCSTLLSNYVHTFLRVMFTYCSEEVCQLLLLSGASFTIQLVPLPQLTHYGTFSSETCSHLNLRVYRVLTTLNCH